MLNLETVYWHTLCPDHLTSSSKVLDLGGNYGLFAKAITERFGCKCVTVEPSPVPFEAIKTSPQILKINAAVGAINGKMRFKVDAENALASSLSADGDIEVDVKTLERLTDEIGWDRIDLLKIDIEGEEIGMLKSTSDDFLRTRIAQITIELHDFCGITPASVVDLTLDRLNRLGFAHVRMSRIGHQDTWLINRNIFPVSDIDLSYARLVTRNWFGLKRVVGRHLG